MLSASLKPRTEVFDNSILPRHWRRANYSDLWSYAPVLRWVVNSVTAAVTVTISSAVGAFGFAYFRFRFRNALLGLGAGHHDAAERGDAGAGLADLAPVRPDRYQVPLWAQNLFGSAFHVFLLRQFFLSIPREYFEAARVAGCSHFGLFRRIALPLARPALVVVFVFETQASWTDLLKPLIYLQDPSLYTLPRGLKAVIDTFGKGGEQHTGRSSWPRR